MTEQVVVVVLGMHRSGTSLVARVLNLLGVYLGADDHLMPADEYNPRGFWEHQAITELNEEVLARLGGSWREPPKQPPGWERSDEFEDLRARAVDIVSNEFSDRAVWGWKDPRTCLTLPFWRYLVPRLRFVLCLRNPVDVAHSLEHTMPFRHGVDLWTTYVRASLISVANEPHQVSVFYEDLMNDPERETTRLLTVLQQGRRRKPKLTPSNVASAIEGELWHHRTSPDEIFQDDRVPMTARILYATLRLNASAGLGPGPRLAQGSLAALARDLSKVAMRDRPLEEAARAGHS
jgi:hypothetical protein